MALIQSIRNWINHQIAVLNCSLNGHSNIAIVECYEHVYRVRNFRGSSLEKLKLAKPYMESFIRGKLRCGSCGRTYIGIIVKGDISQHRHNAHQ